MKPAELRELARLATRLANELDSGPPSKRIGALVEGDQCEKEQSESMDPIDTAKGGASSSPDLIAANLLNRSRRKLPRPPSLHPPARKPRAAP